MKIRIYSGFKTYKYTFYSILILVIFFSMYGCVDTPVDAGAAGSSGTSIKVKISKPVSNDSIGYSGTNIIYSVSGNTGISHVQLFINGKNVNDIIPSNNKILPAVSLDLDSSLIGKKISFYLAFYDLANNWAFSDTVTNLVVTEKRIAPFTPYNLNIIVISQNVINLSWSDSSTGITGYEIYRRTGFGNYSDTPFMVVNPKTFNVNDETLVSDSTYFYRIRSVNKYGISDFSKEVNNIGIGGSIYAPSHLTAVSTGPQTVKLSWRDNSSNENYFRIERRYSFAGFQNIAVLPRNTTTFTDSLNGLAAGTEYYYRVKAYSGTDSSFSNEVSIQTLLYLLKTPAIISLTNPASNKVVVKWKDNDPHSSNYDIFRKSVSDTGYVLMGEVMDYTGIYEDIYVEPNTTYFYKLQSTDGVYTTDFSDSKSITTVVVPPSIPSFTGGYYAGGNKFNVSWTFNGDAKKFFIERKDITAGTTNLIEVNGSLRNYIDTVPNACNHDFEYRIKAVDNYSASDFSDVFSISGGCW